MVTLDTFRKLACSFPETTEEPHFEKISFRVKKKIFATYNDKTKSACLKLSAIDQNVFSSLNTSIIYPLDNIWGKKGWTIIEMQNVHNELFADALTTAYCYTAPKKLAEQVRPKSNEEKRL
jgi:predicted DNA-binding protein (MmcQ/YjbR family)